ncbi:MAG: glycosyltransferase family 4 protein [Pyrinomonadaceae bacterium]
MKILLVKKTSGVGGVQIFMSSLASFYQSQGHHCELFFFSHGRTEEFFPSNVTAHFGDLEDCLRLIKAKRFDVVHANDGDWKIGISATRNFGAKLILTAHGCVKPGRWTYGWTSANCDAYVACSTGVRNELKDFTDVPIRTVLNGVDVNVFKPTEKPATALQPICGWVGRGIDVEYKRLDKLAVIAPMLYRAGIRLWLIEPNGPDEVAKVIPEAVSALLPIVEFWGGVPVDQMPEMYQAIAASGGGVISTSSSEGLPLALLEAQACGCTVIGPDVAGVNECVNPEHGGVLYPSEMEAEQLASLVIATLSDKEKMAWRGKQGSQYVRARFSLEKMAREYLSIYNEAPYPVRGGFLTRLSARLRLSPLFHWKAYVDQRWPIGRLQYELSQKFVKKGESELAAGAARASLTTSPTIYVKPGRAAHFLRTQLR